MRGKRICPLPSPLCLFVLFLSIPACVAAAAQALSLPEAMATALSKNTNIRFSRIGEDISENQLKVRESIYIPFLRAEFSSAAFKKDALTPLDFTKQENNYFLASASAKNSAGGISSLNISTRRDVEFYSTGPVSREYASGAFLRYEQPLLKGFGRDITNLDIDKALYNRALSTRIYEDVKSQILSNVFREYFLLYRMTEELRLQGEIRKNTEEILGMVREKVEARVLPVTELKTVEAMLYMQDRQLLDLANRKRQQANRLMISIQNEPLQRSVEDVALLSTPDDVIRLFVEPEPAVARKRMEDEDIELTRRTTEMALLEKDKLKAVNDLKADLTVTLEAGVGGYDDESISKSIANLSPGNYRALLAGTLSLPVKNTAAENILAETKSKIDQVKIQISNRKNEIGKTSDELFENIGTVRKKQELDRSIVSLTKENLENEIERLLRGKSTAVNTFDYQTNFINAQFDMLNSTVEYALLIGQYYVYVGEMEIFIKPFH